jgi:hypothetical protein
MNESSTVTNESITVSTTTDFITKSGIVTTDMLRLANVAPETMVTASNIYL